MCMWMSGICIYGMRQKESTSELTYVPSPSLLSVGKWERYMLIPKTPMVIAQADISWSVVANDS